MTRRCNDSARPSLGLHITSVYLCSQSFASLGSLCLTFSTKSCMYECLDLLFVPIVTSCFFPCESTIFPSHNPV